MLQTKRKRNQFRLQGKLDIITYHQQNPNKSHKEIANHFSESESEKKMSRSTITKILGAKNLLLEKISKNPDELSRKRNRGERYPFIENHSFYGLRRQEDLISR